MSTTSTATAPDIDPPAGAATVEEWDDLGSPDGAWRTIAGQRRGVDRYYIGSSAVGPHYVEAHGIQEEDGRVTDACVRAEIYAWNLNRHEDWATELSPEQARKKAAELRSTVAELTALADAFDSAASEVEGWTH